MTLPPEPSWSPLQQTLRWSLRPLAFMRECHRRYGDAFSVRFLGLEKPMVMISEPAAIRALYTESTNGLPPGRNIILEPILGQRSVLLLDGAEHLARRKLMLPPFHGERMRAYEETVRTAVARDVDSWPLGTPFPIHSRMQAITLEVILRALFGAQEGQRLDRLRAEIEALLQESTSTLGRLALATRRFSERGLWARFEQQLRRADELMFAEIADHRARPDLAERDDILAMLMTAEFEDGGAMDDQELRDQLVSLLLAGHETTTDGLAWTFDLLLRHPEVLERLCDELASGEEKYLRATISESLRLRPVLPLAGRRLATPLQAGGLDLPAGTDVTPAIWLTHTREDLYPEPFAFRPERFLEGKPDSYAWIPFGGGVRRCLGATFAEFEMRIVLREVLGRCRLRKASSRPERVRSFNITFSPKDGTPVVLESRSAARESVPTSA